MRRAALVVAMVAANAPAAAAEETPPIVVAPFRNHCFDAADLAQRVRAQLPESVVLEGTLHPKAGAYHLVRVSGDERQVTVHLSLRNQRHQVVGSDERLLSLGDDCAAAAETAALMVVRAATPLAFRNPPHQRQPKPPSEIRPKETPPSEIRPKETPPSEIRPKETPPSEIRPKETPPSEIRPKEPPPSEIRPKPPSEIRPSEVRPKPPSEIRPSEIRPKPPSEIRPPKKRHRLELDVVALWTFPLDGPPSTPAGDFTVGWRWRVARLLHAGVGLRAGVSGEWTATSASAQGPITVSARRIPLSAELRLDVDVPMGVFRLSAGPEAVLWVAGSTGLPRPGSAVFAQPGAFVRVAYRLELGPVILQAGVALETAFFHDNLTVGGVGQVAQTPLVLLSPFAGLGVGFF